MGVFLVRAWLIYDSRERQTRAHTRTHTHTYSDTLIQSRAFNAVCFSWSEVWMYGQMWMTCDSWILHRNKILNATKYSVLLINLDLMSDYLRKQLVSLFERLLEKENIIIIIIIMFRFTFTDSHVCSRIKKYLFLDLIRNFTHLYKYIFQEKVFIISYDKIWFSIFF